MSSQTYADEYGRKMMRYRKRKDAQENPNLSLIRKP